MSKVKNQVGSGSQQKVRRKARVKGPSTIIAKSVVQRLMLENIAEFLCKIKKTRQRLLYSTCLDFSTK